jgi:serine/threonine-protein kinase
MDQNPTFAPTIVPATLPLLRLGRYQILAELGQGAMGVVYEARDPTLERHVALKTVRLPSNMQGSSEFRARFHAEAKSAGQLSHPNIVTIYDFGEAEDMAYIAMELLRGETLRELLDRQRFSVRRAVRYAIQIADGLSAAHALNVIHRDIKPANVVRLESGILKITDFGIAQLPASNLSQAGTLLGTPRYMSPELIRGVRVDPRSDIFSLGVVLYEMLTSQLPFDADSLSGIMYKVVNEAPVDPRDLNEHVSSGLTAVLSRCLAKDPADRFGSTLELSRLLRALSEDDAVDLSLLPTFAPRAAAGGDGATAKRGLSGFLRRADRTLPLHAGTRGRRPDTLEAETALEKPVVEASSPPVVPQPRRGRVIASLPLLLALVVVVGIFVASRTQSSGVVSNDAQPAANAAASVLPLPMTLPAGAAQVEQATPDPALASEAADSSASSNPQGAPTAGMSSGLSPVDEKIILGGASTKKTSRKKANDTSASSAPAIDVAGAAALPTPAPEPVNAAAAKPAPPKKPTLQDELRAQRECLVANRCDN